MIVLRDMQADEYPAFCRYFIEDYSQEIAKNYGHSLTVATELANQELQRSLPNALASDGHSLLCIDAVSPAAMVGYLWHSINVSDRSTFIYDFYIASEYRGLGYGTQAIAALEKQLQLASVDQIKLRVAYHNERALKLYKTVGFEITGFNMSKKVGSS